MIVLDTGSTDATRRSRRAAAPACYRPRGRRLQRRAQPRALAHQRPGARCSMPTVDRSGRRAWMPCARAPPASSACCAWTAWSTTSAARCSTAELDPRLLPAGVHYEGHPRQPTRRAAARAQLALSDRPRRLSRSRARRPKTGRNERLLLALAEHPGDAYLYYQLGRISRCARASPRRCPLSRGASRAGETAAAYDLVIRLIFTLKELKQFAQNRRTGQPRGSRRWNDSPDFFFPSATCCSTGRWPSHSAAELLPQIGRAGSPLRSADRRALAADSVRGRSFLAAHNNRLPRAWAGRRQAAQWREREHAGRRTE